MYKVYSASWCKYCKGLKEFLKKEGIPFEEIDIDIKVDEAMYLIEMNLKTIPQVFDSEGNYFGDGSGTIKKLS